jgi:hypothetical protein
MLYAAFSSNFSKRKAKQMEGATEMANKSPEKRTKGSTAVLVFCFFTAGLVVVHILLRGYYLPGIRSGYSLLRS